MIKHINELTQALVAIFSSRARLAVSPSIQSLPKYRHQSESFHLTLRKQIKQAHFPPKKTIPLNNVEMEMQTGAQTLTIRRNNQISTCQVASRRPVFVSSGDTVSSLLWFSTSCDTCCSRTSSTGCISVCSADGVARSVNATRLLTPAGSRQRSDLKLLRLCVTLPVIAY